MSFPLIATIYSMDFTEEDLRSKGFEKQADGSWRKANRPIENLSPVVIKSKEVIAPSFIFLKGNVPSSKNAKQILWLFKPMKGNVIATMKTKNGRKSVTPIISESKLSKQYRIDTKQYWIGYRKYFKKMIEGIDPPYIIEFMFIRKTRAKFDFQNIVQILLDIMQEYDWLEDDDIKNVLPIPPLPPRKSYVVNKEGCGVQIRVVNKNYVNK